MKVLKLGRRARPPTSDTFRGHADPIWKCLRNDLNWSDRVSQGEIDEITSLKKSQTAVSFDPDHLGSSYRVVLLEPQV
jgi:hypothetical protein